MHTQDFPALQRAASLIDYAHVESNFTLALTTLSAQLNRRSLIILFTEFTDATRSEEHTSELQSLMRIAYAVFCLKKKNLSRSASLHTNLQFLKLLQQM